MVRNEFQHIAIDCDSSTFAFPPTRALQASSAQSTLACRLATSADRSSLVTGTTYLRLRFDYNIHDKLRVTFTLLALLGLFFVANLVLAETLHWDPPANPGLITIQSPARFRQRLTAGRGSCLWPPRLNPSSIPPPAATLTRVSRLTFCRLRYHVAPVGRQHSKCLLDNISGVVESGQLLAIMGASGAGKTTLLNLLGGRANTGFHSGQVRICTSPDQPPTIGYAEQMDIHEPKATVREAMLFSARLRQPKHVLDAEKIAWVEYLIPLLELTPSADALIGAPGSGSALSPSDLKRVTIAVELAAKPDILFLDEPTTGLGSEGAQAIARLLRKLADNGQAVACSIHQPSTSTLAQFDQILLLHDGKLVYFGPLGPGLCHPMDYIARHTRSSRPAGQDPIEWMTTQVLGSSLADRKTWADAWSHSEEAKLLHDSLEPALPPVSRAGAIHAYPCQASLGYQIYQLTLRHSRALWRTPQYGFSRFVNHIAMAVVLRVVMPHAGHSIRDLTHRVLALWQTTMLPAFILTTVEYRFHSSRRLALRETATGTYSNTALAASALLAELPYCVICTAGFVLPLFSLAGPLLFSPVAYLALVVFLAQIFCVTFAQTIATLTPHERIATLFNTPSITVFSLFCGISVPRSQLPIFLRNWLYYLDPYTWLMSGLVTNSVHRFDILCARDELIDITVPFPQTCDQVTSLLLTLHDPGYISANTSQVCHYCPLSTGDSYYESLGLSYDQRWKYLGIFSAFCVSNIGLLLITSRIRR